MNAAQKAYVSIQGINVCDQCKNALTREDKMKIVQSLIASMEHWRSADNWGARCFPESFQNCLKILFPEGIK